MAVEDSLGIRAFFRRDKESVAIIAAVGNELWLGGIWDGIGEAIAAELSTATNGTLLRSRLPCCHAPSLSDAI